MDYLSSTKRPITLLSIVNGLVAAIPQTHMAFIQNLCTSDTIRSLYLNIHGNTTPFLRIVWS